MVRYAPEIGEGGMTNLGWSGNLGGREKRSDAVIPDREVIFDHLFEVFATALLLFIDNF